MSKTKRRWWEDVSAADDSSVDLDNDGYEVVEQDASGDWIDTFNFGDYRADKGLSSTDAIWNRYGGYGSSLSGLGSASGRAWSSNVAKAMASGMKLGVAKRIESAQRLVQGFIDTFALDNPLTASFQDGARPAGMPDGAKSVVVSHRPLLDPTLSDTEAHRVMTAQAAQGAARARFGGLQTIDRLDAVRDVFHDYSPDSVIADELAGILDGYRIDSAFRRDYPGYEDVYAPAQAYIARGLLGEREAFNLEDFAGASIANAALNYGDFTDWNGRGAEREWWIDWADKYASGSVDRFVDGIVEGVAHLHEELPPRPDKPKDGDESKPKGDQNGDGEGGGSSDSDDGDGESGGDKQDEQPEGDEGGDTGSSSGAGDDINESGDDDGDGDPGQGDPGQGDATDGDPTDGDGQGDTNGQIKLPTGLGDGVSLTGLANGQTEDIDESQAEELGQMAGALAIGLDEKELGEVYWTANGFKSPYNKPVAPKVESAANGYIRRAFTRSKTSHFASERGHVSGRIDNRSLPRIASDDYRLFSKRIAPSDTRYRVWLLVDNSGSMSGSPARDCINLAASVALAVRHIPNVSLDVWAWTTGIKVPGAVFSAVRVYADGDPITKIGDVSILAQGGTPDGAVLSWATREIRKQCRPDETPVILVASDGSGSLIGEAWMRDPGRIKEWRRRGHTEEQISQFTSQVRKDRVAVARKAGIKVLSVAIGALDPAAQDMIYGRGNHLIWRGSIKAMAKPLGDLLARVASNRVN